MYQLCFTLKKYNILPKICNQIGLQGHCTFNASFPFCYSSSYIRHLIDKLMQLFCLHPNNKFEMKNVYFKIKSIALQWEIHKYNGMSDSLVSAWALMMNKLQIRSAVKSGSNSAKL